MDGVQLPQGYSYFEEAVYFLPFSSQMPVFLNRFYRPKITINYQLLTDFKGCVH